MMINIKLNIEKKPKKDNKFIETNNFFIDHQNIHQK